MEYVICESGGGDFPGYVAPKFSAKRYTYFKRQARRFDTYEEASRLALNWESVVPAKLTGNPAR